MPIFNYRAIAAGGITSTGTIEARDRRQALQKLEARKLRPLAVTATQTEAGSSVSSPAGTSGKEGGGQRTLFQTTSKPKLGLNFLRRLLDLLHSGIPLGDAVKLLSQRIREPQLKTFALDLWKNLSEGRTFAAVAAQREGYFGASAAPLIEAGEATGHLAPIIEKIVAYREEAATMRNKVIGSLIYPVFICLLAGGVVAFFLFVLLPKIRGMISQLGGDMHWTAKALTTGADWTIHGGPFVLLAIGLGIIGLVQWRKSDQGREQSDGWLLKIPFIGRIVLNSEVFQLSILMTTLIESGINTTETLRLAEKSIRNSFLRRRFTICRQQIQEGVSMSKAFDRLQLMSDLAIDILTVGENTGNLAHSLREISKIHRRELTQRLRILTVTISSAALGFAFLLVALIAMSIVLAVVNVGTNMSF